MMVNLKDENTLAQNLELIRQALKESYCVISNGAVGNDLGYLCNSKKISWWSKAKPLDSDSKERLTEQQRRDLSYGISASGVDIFSQEGKNQALENAINGVFGWLYNRPKGGEESKYRLWDFNGYEHNSVSPLYLNVKNENESVIDIKFAADQTTRQVDIEIGALEKGLPEGNMLLSDITSILGDVSSEEGWLDKGYMLLYKEKNDTNVSDTGYDNEDGDLKYPMYSTDEEGNMVMKAIIPITMQLNKTYQIAGVLLNSQKATNFMFPHRVLTVRTSLATPDAVVLLISSEAKDEDYTAKFSVIATSVAVRKIEASAYIRYVNGDKSADYEFNTIDIPTQNIDLNQSSEVSFTIVGLKELIKNDPDGTYTAQINITVNKGNIGFVPYKYTEDVTDIFNK